MTEGEDEVCDSAIQIMTEVEGEVLCSFFVVLAWFVARVNQVGIPMRVYYSLPL